MSRRASRLQIQLEQTLRNAGSGPAADSVRADLVSQMARGGHYSEAEAVLANLRAKYDTKPNAIVTPWLNFAEATLDLRQGRADAALMKMRRAHALSALSGIPLTHFAAATLAHMYWNRENVEEAVRYANECLAAADAHDHRTLCRISMVIGEILAISRREREAEPWFKKTRRHAASSGDDAAISSLAFNLAVIQGALLRQALLDSGQSEQRESRALILARCSNELNSLLQISVSDAVHIQSAQLMSLLNRHEEALSIYETQIDVVKIASAGRRRSTWLSDMAWCLISVDRREDARRVARDAVSAIAAEVQVDDRATTHSRLAAVFAALGDPEAAKSNQSLANKHWRQYWDFQDRCAYLCEPLCRYLT